MTFLYWSFLSTDTDIQYLQCYKLKLDWLPQLSLLLESHLGCMQRMFGWWYSFLWWHFRSCLDKLPSYSSRCVYCVHSHSQVSPTNHQCSDKIYLLSPIWESNDHCSCVWTALYYRKLFSSTWFHSVKLSAPGGQSHTEPTHPATALSSFYLQNNILVTLVVQEMSSNSATESNLQSAACVYHVVRDGESWVILYVLYFLAFSNVFLLLQYQQHPDGHGEHCVQRSLHPGHAQRSWWRCSFRERLSACGGQVSELHMLLGSLPAAVSQQPRPGRTHQSHTCGRTERRGQCCQVTVCVCVCVCVQLLRMCSCS